MSLFKEKIYYFLRDIFWAKLLHFYNNIDARDNREGEKWSMYNTYREGGGRGRNNRQKDNTVVGGIPVIDGGMIERRNNKQLFKGRKNRGRIMKGSKNMEE
jgi:hypothetical protein